MAWVWTSEKPHSHPFPQALLNDYLIPTNHNNYCCYMRIITKLSAGRNAALILKHLPLSPQIYVFTYRRPLYKTTRQVFDVLFYQVKPPRRRRIHMNLISVLLYEIFSSASFQKLDEIGSTTISTEFNSLICKPQNK